MPPTESQEVLCVGPAAGTGELPGVGEVAEELRERGFAVRVAGDSGAALHHLERSVPGCLVTEYRLEGPLDGIELIRAIRDQRPGLPVVLLADGDEVIAAEAVSAGIDEYVRLCGENPVETASENAAAFARSAPGAARGLHGRAVAASPLSVTIADARAPDMPLVYVNEAFEETTGYTAGDTIGRNCRFLQGEPTDERNVAAMREAIDTGETVSVTLRNYRKDGELFWNEVTLAPLRDRGGNITHFVGFQNDVTRRKEAELAVERRAATHRMLLDRMEAVLGGVVAPIVTAQHWDSLCEGVCDRLADTYVAAWYGPYDPSTETVTPTARRPPMDGQAGDEALSVSDPATDEPPVARAVREGTVKIGGGAAARPHAEVAAVPVTYGDTTFGVLCVYASNGFVDATEHELLGVLGTMMATGLNALESQRTLLVDERVEVRLSLTKPDAPLPALAARLGTEFTLEESLASDGQDLLLFRAAGAESTAIEDALAELGLEGQALTNRDEYCLFEVTTTALGALDVLREHGATLRDIQVDTQSIELRIETAREARARSIVDALSEEGEVEVEGFTRRERRPTTQTEFVEGVEADLTDRQRTALVKSYAGGLFEWPRDVTGEELASSMGIGRSTFHQHLTAAQRKLVSAFLDG